MITSFNPIESKDSKILILGTMPGERSIKSQQYYGHAGNAFWKIMFDLFHESFTTNYSTRVNLLNSNKIALWDVLKYCYREGSSDTNIKNEIPNNFGLFYKSHPKIKHVFFSSKKAEKFYDKYVGRSQDIVYNLLSSPSSANTWKKYPDKLKDWEQILTYLN